MIDLEAIRESLTHTTPAPWLTEPETEGHLAGRTVVVTDGDGWRVVTVGQDHHHRDGVSAEANVTFIAQARRWVPELVDMVEHLSRLAIAANACHDTWCVLGYPCRNHRLTAGRPAPGETP